MYTLFCNTVMKSSVIANTRSGADDCFHMILSHQGENTFSFLFYPSVYLQFLYVSFAPVTLGQISSDNSLMNKRKYLYRAAQIKSSSFFILAAISLNKCLHTRLHLFGLKMQIYAQAAAFQKWQMLSISFLKMRE